VLFITVVCLSSLNFISSILFDGHLCSLSYLHLCTYEKSNWIALTWKCVVGLPWQCFLSFTVSFKFELTFQLYSWNRDEGKILLLMHLSPGSAKFVSLRLCIATKIRTENIQQSKNDLSILTKLAELIWQR
jgi:hypothetical protein